jgi:hypothetical protein
MINRFMVLRARSVVGCGLPLVKSALLLGLLCAPALAQEKSGRYTAQLRDECDALIRDAVKRPYGWGWDPLGKPDESRKPTTRPIPMEPLTTPAAGVVLHLSGKLLDEPRYTQAALEVARGIAGSQSATGKIPSVPVFGPTSAGGRDIPSVVPDRSSTCAALGLLLTVIDSSTIPDERLHRSATRAAFWLFKQLTPNGGWQVAFPADVPARDSARLFDLSTPDYRDSTYALLLAGEVLKDQTLARGSDKTINLLMLLRINDTRDPGHQLWSAASTLAGVPDGHAVRQPGGADLLASRFAIQTLLGGYLLRGDKPWGVAMDNATRSITALRRADGSWDRFVSRPGTDAEPVSGAWNAGDFGLADTLGAVAALKAASRENYVLMVERGFTLRQHLAGCLTGLIDIPFTLNFPVAKADVEAFIDKHRELWKLADGPMPENLQDRVRRLLVLYVRAKIERL